jgi:hypothetical protein
MRPALCHTASRLSPSAQLLKRIMASKIGIKGHRAKPLKGGQRASSTTEVKSAGHLYLQVARTL